MCIIKIIENIKGKNENENEYTYFSSKKLVLGIVTTVIGISTIALVSENAYASTSTVKSQIVKNTTKPTTTVKTVKPIAVKTALCQIGLMSS